MENSKCKSLIYIISEEFICFSRPATHTVYAKSVNSLTESLCLILQSHPMGLIYLNDYNNENHASPAAYIFFLKLFTFLQYPILTFHYFHPFHPAVKLINKLKKNFSLSFI